MVRSVEQPGGTRAILEMFRAREIDAEQNRPHYSDPISCPVLAVGAQAYLGKQVYTQLAQVASNVRGAVIAESGHNIALENPTAVAGHTSTSSPESELVSAVTAGLGRSAARLDELVGLGDPVEREDVAGGIESADSAAAVVRSRAAASLASCGKSSLPSSRIVTLAKSIGQNGSSARSWGWHKRR